MKLLCRYFQKERIGAGTVDEEPLTHYHPNPVSQTESVSQASGARKGDSPAVSQCAVAGTGMLGLGRLCLYLSLNALPVVVWC